MEENKIHWKHFFLEILSIFIAVTLAFAITKWNDNRQNHQSETKILTEIRNGLKQDLDDLQGNLKGHKLGIEACDYFRRLIKNEAVNRDSLAQMYFYLFRDFISIQNSSGYESLKSKGLEIIENDSLRYNIINLYDFDYEIIEKLEETYSEMQFNQTYFNNFNDSMAKYFIFDDEGELSEIEQSIDISEAGKKKLFSYLWRIKKNRNFTLNEYVKVEQKVIALIDEINTELEH